MKKIKKNNKGITLVALVITIIILLILAGISISSLTENGLFKKAEIAKENTRGANVKEQVELWKTEKKANEYSNTDSKIMTEKELLDDIELNQKLLTNNERTSLEMKRQVTIGNQTITLDDEKKETATTSVYAKLYSYKDGTDGYVLELSNDASDIDSNYNLEENYNNIDVGNKTFSEELPPWIDYDKSTRIEIVKIRSEIAPISTSNYFCGCEALTQIEGLEKLNTSNVVDMNNMFGQCNNLTSINLSNFNTSKVANMSNMFRECYDLESLNLSNFKTSKVTNMSGMFKNCIRLTMLDLSSFDTSSVTNMSYMFSSCVSLTELSISNFCVENVTNMTDMFYYCTNLETLDLSSFNPSKVENMQWMFRCCENLKTINFGDNFNTGKVTSMQEMFSECDNLENLDLSSFDTKNVTTMYRMFYGCQKLSKLNVSSFDTKMVTNMSEMFSACEALTELDLKSFNTSNTSNMSLMFNMCAKLKSILVTNSNWNTENANTDRMFQDCGVSSVTYES